MNQVYSDVVSERGKGNLNEMTPGTYYLNPIQGGPFGRF